MYYFQINIPTNRPPLGFQPKYSIRMLTKRNKYRPRNASLAHLPRTHAAPVLSLFAGCSLPPKLCFYSNLHSHFLILRIEVKMSLLPPLLIFSFCVCVWVCVSVSMCAGGWVLGGRGFQNKNELAWPFLAFFLLLAAFWFRPKNERKKMMWKSSVSHKVFCYYATWLRIRESSQFSFLIRNFYKSETDKLYKMHYKKIIGEI